MITDGLGGLGRVARFWKTQSVGYFGVFGGLNFSLARLISRPRVGSKGMFHMIEALLGSDFSSSSSTQNPFVSQNSSPLVFDS